MPTTARFDVIYTEGRFNGITAGHLVGCHKGWRFFPHYQAKPSRKFHATTEAALKGRVRNYRLNDRS